MIKEIQDVFISNLEQLSWMDSQTKEAAKEKVLKIKHDNKICEILLIYTLLITIFVFSLHFPPQAKAIREQIGYSDKILDDEYLNKEYSDVWTAPLKPHISL